MLIMMLFSHLLHWYCHTPPPLPTLHTTLTQNRIILRHTLYFHDLSHHWGYAYSPGYALCPRKMAINEECATQTFKCSNWLKMDKCRAFQLYWLQFHIDSNTTSSPLGINRWVDQQLSQMRHCTAIHDLILPNPPFPRRLYLLHWAKQIQIATTYSSHTPLTQICQQWIILDYSPHLNDQPHHWDMSHHATGIQCPLKWPALPHFS